MTDVRIAPPEPMELVPAETVDELVARTSQEFALLERQVADANAAADATEARAAAEGADERATSWTMVQLQRFINTLRDELDLELRAIAEVADHRAKRRIEEAHAQADLVRRLGADAQEAVSASPLSEIPTPDPQELFTGPIAEPLAAPPLRVVMPESVITDAVAPVAFKAVVSVPEIVEPSLAPVADWASLAPEPAAADLMTAALAPVEISAPPAPPMFGAEVLIDPMASDASTAGEHAPVAGAEFWADHPEPKRKGLRRLPIAAVLQVLAVLLILAFILLRLG